MTDDGGHTRRYELAPGGDRLLGVAVIIDRREFDLLAENAARRVQLGDLQADAFLQSLTKPGYPARDADQDFGVSSPGCATPQWHSSVQCPST